MIFGIPLEMRNLEYRVGAVPFLVAELAKHGHKVYVESRAGEKCGYSDNAYEDAGAVIAPSPEKLYGQAEFILKIRDPKLFEVDLISPDHTIFSFANIFHQPEYSRALAGRGCSWYTYDMLLEGNGRPLMDAMLHIEGQLAIQQGANYLLGNTGGLGVLLGNAPGSAIARVTIIGNSTAAESAANWAANNGAAVNRLLPFESDGGEGPNLFEKNLRAILPETDLLLSAVIDIDNNANHSLSGEMFREMPAGSVVVDLDVDYGGGFDMSNPTRPETPLHYLEHVWYYGLSNLAGLVQRTASDALSNVLLPYLLAFSEDGFQKILSKNPDLGNGLLIYEGRIANERLAGLTDLPFFNLRENGGE